MKKLLEVLFLLFVFYSLYQIGFSYFDGSSYEEYAITNEDKEFLISEEYKINFMSSNYYYIEITYKDKIFNLTVPNNYKNLSNIVEDVNYVDQSGVVCLLPVFKEGKFENEPLCYENQDYVSYSLIKDKYNFLNNFYNLEETYDGVSNTNNHYNFYEYTSELNDNLLIWDKKGFYSINKNKVSFVIEENDGQTDLNYIYDTLYIYPNYSGKTKKDTYLKLNIYNIETKQEESLIISEYLSDNFYYQGVIKDKLYMVDIDSEKQWEINLETLVAQKVGDANIGGVFYEEGTKKQINFNLLLSEEKVFEAEDKNFEGYEAYKTNNLYYLLNNSNIYKVYENNKDLMMYTLSLSNATDIELGENVYFAKDNIIYIYNSKQGILKLIENEGANFTNNNVIDVY